MKIQQLNFVAFGPFTEKVLAFDQEKDGLHIIYGPNEAGKSSALRGLKALLYGIDERTPDNFLHANDKLRINGCLRTAGGDALEFSRRKGRKNTLLNLEGEVIDEQSLSAFLQGVTPELFAMLFGIDHQSLLQGGQEILEQKGEVGQALFSAAIGSHTLHTLLEQLENEANELFRPRGSTQTINLALKSYHELKKKIREQSLSSRDWQEHRQAFDKAAQELVQVQLELADNRTEVNRLKRIQRLLPKLAQRGELLKELVQLGDVVILADDFSERHQQSQKQLETAQAILETARHSLQGLQQQIDELIVSQDLLAQAENIEDLHARLAGYRKALQDRPRLIAERQQLLTEAEYLLKEVRPELEFKDIEVLRPVLSKRQFITELASENAELLSRVKQVETSQRETQAQLITTHNESIELPDTGSTDELHRAIATARKLGAIDTDLQSAHSEFEALRGLCESGLSRLTLWQGGLDELSALQVPNRESINYFEQVYGELDKRLQRLDEKQAEAAEDVQETSLRLDEIQRAGSVPTEENLVVLRCERDQVWDLLRRQWFEGEDVSADQLRLGVEGVLADGFEERLLKTDELSDRLRREADRVHQTAVLQAKQESLQLQKESLDQEFATHAAKKTKADEQWQALWSPCQIQPRTPREMRIWLDELVELRQQTELLTGFNQKEEELRQTCKTQIQLLNQQLEALGENISKSEVLETVLLECEAAAKQIDEIKQQTDELDKEINKLEIKLQSLSGEHQLASGELETWEINWREMIESSGLHGDSQPSEMSELIEKIREMFSSQSEADKLQIRINVIDDDIELYHSQVNNTISSVDPELEALPADKAVIRLNSLLSDNQTKLTRRQQVEIQLEQGRQDKQDSEVSIQIMTERLDSLCVEAKCDGHGELEKAGRTSIGYIELKAKIDSIEHEILQEGEGATVDALEKEAGAVEADELPGRIDELKHKIDDELESKRTRLAETRGREEKELEMMNGSDDVAVLAEQAEAILASIRSQAEAYVRVKLAGRVLRDEVERYRKENQGPLIKRASEYFSILTRGSFENLRTDFNDKDEPVLVGVRPGENRSGEKRILVEGMSAGTRDQLYLALRLASLEKYMETSEPMPFIVDDILVDFDDERTEAALTTLSQLAQKTQVILFTHHSGVVEQARKIKTVQIHNL